MQRDDRWQNLVSGAFRLGESEGRLQDGPSAAQALAYLDNVLEVFGPSIDPVTDFEGYAVRRMALALRQALLAAQARHEGQGS
jgi:hypothetical protein